MWGQGANHRPAVLGVRSGYDKRALLKPAQQTGQIAASHEHRLCDLVGCHPSLPRAQLFDTRHRIELGDGQVKLREHSRVLAGTDLIGLNDREPSGLLENWAVVWMCF